MQRLENFGGEMIFSCVFNPPPFWAQLLPRGLTNFQFASVLPARPSTEIAGSALSPTEGRFIAGIPFRSIPGSAAITWGTLYMKKETYLNSVE